MSDEVQQQFGAPPPALGVGVGAPEPTLDMNDTGYMRAIRYFLAAYAIVKNAPGSWEATTAYQLLKDDPTNWTQNDADLWDKVVGSQSSPTAVLSVQHAGLSQPTALGVSVLVVASQNANVPGAFSDILSHEQLQNYGLAAVPAWVASGGAQGTLIPTDHTSPLLDKKKQDEPAAPTTPAPTTSYWPWILVGGAALGIFALAVSGAPKKRRK